MSYFNKTKVVDNNGGMLTFDAFSRAEVAPPYGEADYTFLYDLNPTLWDNISTGSAFVSHVANESSVTLNSGTATGDAAIFQSRRYHRYQAGRGGKIQLTSVVGAATTGVTKRWGYFDGNNGLFFQQDGDGTFSVNLRTYTSGSAVTTKITQANFNLDKADGTGNSGFTLDLSKGNIFEIDFQWLGVGVVTFRLAAGDGSVIDLHKIHNPNANTEVYMSTATLPVRYEVENTGSPASAGTMKAICSSVVSSGGEDPPEIEFGFGNITAVSTSTTAETHVISFRPKLTFAGQSNRMVLLPKDFSFASDLGSCIFRVHLNATLTTAASWTSVHADSGMEYSLSGAVSAAGKPIRTIPILASSGNAAQVSRSRGFSATFKNLALTTSADASSSDILTITVTKLGTTNVTALASMTWGEVR